MRQDEVVGGRRKFLGLFEIREVGWRSLPKFDSTVEGGSEGRRETSEEGSGGDGLHLPNT